MAGPVTALVAVGGQPHLLAEGFDQSPCENTLPRRLRLARIMRQALTWAWASGLDSALVSDSVSVSAWELAWALVSGWATESGLFLGSDSVLESDLVLGSDSALGSAWATGSALVSGWATESGLFLGSDSVLESDLVLGSDSALGAA